MEEHGSGKSKDVGAALITGSSGKLHTINRILILLCLQNLCQLVLRNVFGGGNGHCRAVLDKCLEYCVSSLLAAQSLRLSSSDLDHHL